MEYANAIAPPGMSATMQGIAAGMDDGFGEYIFDTLWNRHIKTISTKRHDRGSRLRSSCAEFNLFLDTCFVISNFTGDGALGVGLSCES